MVVCIEVKHKDNGLILIHQVDASCITLEAIMAICDRQDAEVNVYYK